MQKRILPGILLPLGFLLLVNVSMSRAQDPFVGEIGSTGFDEAVAAVTDSTGLYVTGISASGGRVSKYRENRAIWTRTFLGFGEGIAAGGGFVYVLATGGENHLRGYDATGNELWAKQMRGIANGIAADATGLYFVGRGTPASYDGVVRKFAPDGREIWNRVLRNSYPTGVAADGTKVYVVSGMGASGGGRLHAFGHDGAELWMREFEAQWTGAIAVNESAIYVIGRSEGMPFLAKHDLAGVELWRRQLGWNSEDPGQPEAPFVSLASAAVDATGVYVAGKTYAALPDQCRSGWGSDAFVMKFDFEGSRVWVRQFGGSLSSAWASGIAVDADRLYAAGVAARCEPRASGDTGAPSCAATGLIAELKKSPGIADPALPRIFPGCLINAASYIGGSVSPGEIVRIRGNSLGPSDTISFQLTPDNRLPTSLGETRVLMNGVAAPLISVSGDEITALVPYFAPEQSTVDLLVERQSKRSDVVSAPLSGGHPGIFTLPGSVKKQAAALNEDGTINSPYNPANLGSIITIFATGAGKTNRPIDIDRILGDVLPTPRSPISVEWAADSNSWDYDYGYGPRSASPILYAGGSPGSVAGLLQVNTRVAGGTGEFILCVAEDCTDYSFVFVKD